MASFLSPFVSWAQSEANVFLKIDLKDAKDPTVKFEKRKLEFESEGVGASGAQNYAFSLDFYSEINTEQSSFKILDSNIDVNIVKAKKGVWPQLTSKAEKLAWLKIDLHRWPVLEEYSDSDAEEVQDVREEFSRSDAEEIEDVREDSPDVREPLQMDDSRDINKDKRSSMDYIEISAIAVSVLLLILTIPFSLFCCIKIVQEYERAVIFRLGRIRRGGVSGPGIFFILPCVDKFCKMNLRTVSVNAPSQEVLTKDSVNVTIDAVIHYRIVDPLKAVYNSNCGLATCQLAMVVLRRILGERNLAEILSDRAAISRELRLRLCDAAASWGIKVEMVEIKDISLPQQLQRAMAAEAEASREARAKVIAAKGEMKASTALKEAADVICESSGALHLRYLHTLKTTSAEKSSIIIIPLPIDTVAAFVQRKNG